MPIIDNPKLYEKAKKIANEKYSKPSAYRSGFLVKTYKSMGGTYTDDNKTKDLRNWFLSQWKDIGDEDYPVYRPTKKIGNSKVLLVNEIDPKNLKEQIKLKQKIKGERNLPAFKPK